MLKAWPVSRVSTHHLDLVCSFVISAHAKLCKVRYLRSQSNPSARSSDQGRVAQAEGRGMYLKWKDRPEPP